MTRRQEIENIIVGTILNSNSEENYLNDCKSCVTADMFLDERNRRIYSKAIEMQKVGNEISPYDMIEYDASMLDDAAYMCELATDWHFLQKKVMYNEKQWLQSLVCDYKPKYTDVTFSDYVNRFIQLVFTS